jgi:anaerobic magnesium-protoporphyrin IX monomethyl ester cyclase
VGNDDDDINEFYKSIKLPSGLLRTGMSDERILDVAKDFDIIGLTSIFSSQETMVLYCCELIKKHYPDKLLLSGGVNARWRADKFLNHGFDIVATSEAEHTVQEIIKNI